MLAVRYNSSDNTTATMIILINDSDADADAGEDGALFERDRDERAQFHIVCDRYTSEYAHFTF
jgi:hypothetical protein